MASFLESVINFFKASDDTLDLYAVQSDLYEVDISPKERSLYAENDARAESMSGDETGGSVPIGKQVY